MTEPMSPAELRKACGVSQKELAAALGVDPSLVCRWEKGLTFPDHAHREAWFRVQRGLRRHLEVTW